MSVRSRLAVRSMAPAAMAFALWSASLASAAAQQANNPALMSARPDIALVQSGRVVDPACFCWANGERFNRGETACLRTGMGRRLAQCDQVTNVMSWSFSTNDCPES
jgi:hypothetical protein